MMQTNIFKYQLVESYGSNRHAGSKAKNDAAVILEKAGYQRMECIVPFFQFYRKKHAKILQPAVAVVANLFSILSLMHLFFKLHTDAALIIQYPFEYIRIHRSIKKAVFNLLKMKRIQSIVLIHDLDGIRFENLRRQEYDIMILKESDIVIAHSTAMKEYLQKQGIQSDKIRILNLFDYLISKPVSNTDRKKENTVAFAGNLSKSEFLPKLPSITNIQFFLYGNTPSFDIEHTNCCYKGSYTPEELPSLLKGSFGLVWDGDSTETCSGIIGQYLQYNAPHKASLYIVSERPVIIWKKSALADFITDNNLGIAIHNLNEIPQVLEHLTESEYMQMMQSVQIFAKKLRNGEQLLHAIN